ncbi:MAG: hypothetical protein Q9M94_05075 [Candidatus Gracilibacteria bacterium]|nr:hypothetical protein [Candidatus Gracilibacteria bacterium]
MKILSNFDTRLDGKTFLKKVEQYGNHNVLLIKRHPLFLYKAFINLLVGLGLFSGLLYLLYIQYSENIIYFYVFLILHLLGIGLWIIILLKKIISNLWTYKEFITCREDLAKIDMSQFGSFLKYSMIIFLYQFFISVINMIILFTAGEDKMISFGWSIGIFIINILFLIITIKILKRFIDFEMDFIIVTRDEIESFVQEGLFKRKVVSLDIKKIRSITTEKDGFFKSLFNIGSLKILSEGDNEGKGEIRFNYIHRLGKLKIALSTLIHQNNKKDINLSE